MGTIARILLENITVMIFRRIGLIDNADKQTERELLAIPAKARIHS